MIRVLKCRKHRRASSTEIKQEQPAVRMAGFATGRVRLENWNSRRKVLHLTHHVCRHQISSDKIALRIPIGIDSVNDTKLAQQNFNRHIIGGGNRPKGAAIHLVICFPNAEVMTAGHYGRRIGQGIRVVLCPPEDVKSGHGELGVMVSLP